MENVSILSARFVRMSFATLGLGRKAGIARFVGGTLEPLRVTDVLSMPSLASHRVHIHFLRCRRARSSRQEPSMLDEHQTLAILSWTLGSVCLGTFLLSALALH
jgi:hypothetical protein